MKLFKWIKPINTYGQEGNPFLNSKKYSVHNGSIVVSVEELVKSEKFKKDCEMLRNIKF
jgi:hypothetical protein